MMSSRKSLRSRNSHILKFLPYPDPALLAHELLNVVRTACAPSCGSAGFPAAERIDAWPGAGRGAGAAVGVGDARLDPIEEVLDLAVVLGEDARRAPVFRAVRKIDCLVQRHHVTDDGN